MQEIFDLIYFPDDLMKTVCSLVCLILVFELIFGVVSIISHAIKGGR